MRFFTVSKASSVVFLVRMFFVVFDVVFLNFIGKVVFLEYCIDVFLMVIFIVSVEG